MRVDVLPRPNTPKSFSRFAVFSGLALLYNIGVILWGAYVRATGSGAGCGAHWPLCNGEIIPASPSVARMIEYSHRVTSGLTLILVAVLVVWAFRAFPSSSPIRLGAMLSLVFTLTEALVGAGLVLFQLVAGDTSGARTVSIAIHLTNTFLLLAALTLTCFWALGGRSLHWYRRRASSWLVLLGLVALLGVGVTGAITALGDTLFPAGSLAEGLQQDFSSTAQFLIRLRVYHPIAAIAVGLYILLLIRGLASLQGGEMQKVAAVTAALIALQWLLGALNVYLLAPLWLQMLHLLVADLIWITFVWFSALLLSKRPEDQPSYPLTHVFKAIVGMN